MEGGDEDGESEGGVAEETVKLENDGEWDGCFEYNHAGKWPTSLRENLREAPYKSMVYNTFGLSSAF